MNKQQRTAAMLHDCECCGIVETSYLVRDQYRCSVCSSTCVWGEPCIVVRTFFRTAEIVADISRTEWDELSDKSPDSQ